MAKDSDKPWFLKNVEELASEVSDSFNVPELREREALTEGKIVRLHFALKDTEPSRAERMWVRVKELHEGYFIGELLDEPVLIPCLSKGDEIKFRTEHIATILIEKDDPRWIDETKNAFVSNRILKENAEICFLYRESPTRKDDSGWRIFAGNENEKYLSDAKNFQICSLEMVLNIDESLEVILAKPVFSAFERETKGKPFQEVKEFEFDRS